MGGSLYCYTPRQPHGQSGREDCVGRIEFAAFSGVRPTMLYRTRRSLRHFRWLGQSLAVLG
ncbi:MAG TPA: hypothetical protein PK867_23510 [Pirellulales bacterium]|nr:hypothetical protein [Pirellulales bacterium]